MQIFYSILNALRVLHNRRMRLAEAQQVAHERQLAVIQLQMESRTRELEVIFEALADRDKSNSDAVMEMAKGSQEMAKAFGSWLQMFQTSAKPEFSIVRDEDELRVEKDRLREMGFPVESGADLQLAYVLEQMNKVADLD